MDFCKQSDLAGNLVMYCNRDAGDTFYTDNQGQLSISYYDVTYTAGRRKQNKDSDGKITSQTATVAREILLYSPMITAMNCTLTKVVKTEKKVKKGSVELDPAMFETA
jgi:hypothetical protein